MRFLITGGAGFIGSHLSDLLIEHDHAVHVLDDLSTGGIENIRHLKGHPEFEYTIGSAENHAVVAELVDEADIVVHLAAAVGVTLVVESPVRAIETNVHGTEVVLMHANKKKKPVLIASTSEVYGKSQALPFREDGDLQMGATDKGRWAYACSKAIDEFLAMAYWRERALPTTVVRLFNTVGPRQTGSYGMVVPRLVGQALAGEPLTIYGDGRQTRCFCHVADVVAGPVRPGDRRARLRKRVQRRRHHRDLDPRPRPADHRRDGLQVGDLLDPLRRGLRGGLRGHVPPRARHDQGPRADRLAPDPDAGGRGPGRGRMPAGARHNVGPVSLSICLITADPPERIAAILEPLRAYADEVLIAADSRVDEQTLSGYNAIADRLFRIEHVLAERHLAWMFAQCGGDWILRLDGDELPSDALIRRLPELLSSRDVQQFWIRRAWLYPDPDRFLACEPWSEDFVNRLMRNDGTLRVRGLQHTRPGACHAARVHPGGALPPRPPAEQYSAAAREGDALRGLAPRPVGAER